MILQLLWIIADVSPAVLMSGPGQTRHFDRAPITSGLLQQADLLKVRRHVSNVPISEVVALFDNLVR